MRNVFDTTDDHFEICKINRKIQQFELRIFGKPVDCKKDEKDRKDQLGNFMNPMPLPIMKSP